MPPPTTMTCLRVERRRQPVFGLASARRVDRAGHLAEGGEAAHAAFLAREARPDTVDLAGPDLLRQIRIGEQRPGEADHVGLAGPERLGRPVRVVHASRGDDRNADRLLQDFVERQVEALGLVHRRVAPVPAVVGADVAVERVVAGGLEKLRRLDPFGNVAAHLLELFARQAALQPVLDEALDRIAQRHRVVLAAARLDRVNDFGGKAQPVLQAAAVFVGALVEHGDGELVEQVALVDGVDLDPVESGSLGDFRGVGELADVGPDLDVGELAADHARRPAVRNRRRAHRRSVHEAGNADPSEAGGKLQEHARVIGMDALGHDLAGLDEIARIEGRTRHRGQHALLDLVLDLGDAGHDEAGAALRPFDIIFDAARVVRPVGVAQAPGADRLHHIAVLDLQFPDLGRRKEDFVLPVHVRRPRRDELPVFPDSAAAHVRLMTKVVAGESRPGQVKARRRHRFFG